MFTNPHNEPNPAFLLTFLQSLHLVSHKWDHQIKIVNNADPFQSSFSMFVFNFVRIKTVDFSRIQTQMYKEEDIFTDRQTTGS